jgi:hypothetical protein
VSAKATPEMAQRTEPIGNTLPVLVGFALPGESANFSQRCMLAANCLPEAEYRACLQRLHADMIGEIERLRAAYEYSEAYAMRLLTERDRLHAALTACQEDAARMRMWGGMGWKWHSHYAASIHGRCERALGPNV